MKLWSHARPYLPLGPFFGLLALMLYIVTLEPFAYPGESALLMVRFARLDPFVPLTNTLWGWCVRVVAALPGGALAGRLNALSAVCAAGTVWAIYTLVARIPHNRTEEEKHSPAHRVTLQTIAASFAALYLMGSLPFWVVATRAHHLTFDALLLVLLALLFQRFWKTRNWRLFHAFCLAYAAVVTEVPLLLLVAPVLLLFALIAMLQAGRLDARTIGSAALAVLAGSLLWLVPVWQLHRHPTAEWFAFAHWGDSLRAVAVYVLANMRRHAMGTGWLLILLIAVLPGIVVLAPKHADRNRVSQIGSWLLHAVLGLLALVTLYRLPFSPLSHLEPGRYLALPFVMIAVWGGYIAGYGAALLHSQRPPRPTVRPLRYAGLSLREWSYCTVLAILLVASGLHSALAWPSRAAVAVHTLAEETLNVLGDRTWLVTNGQLDPHLRLLAADQNRPLTLIDYSQARAPHYRRYVASLFDEPRYQSLAGINLTALLADWLKNEPDAVDRMALLTWPDYWLAADYTPIPLNTCYLGAANPDDWDTDTLYHGFRDFHRRLGSPTALHTPYAPQLGIWAVRHLGKLANDLGVLLEDREETDRAETLYHLARETDPENLSALLNLIALGQRIDHPDTAVWQESLQQRLERRERRPDIWMLASWYGYVRNPAVHFMRGRAWVASGKPRAGLREIERAGALAGRTTDPELLVDTALDPPSRPADPLAVLQRRLEANPDNPDLLYALFQSYLRRHETDLAATTLNQLQLVAPDRSLALEQASLAVLQGRTTEAAEIFATITREQPDHVRAWAGRALLALERGDETAAERGVRQILNRAEGRPDLLFVAARIYAQMGRATEAQRLLERCLALQPGFLPAHELLLAYDWQFGRREPARRRIETLLAANPDHSLANYALGTLQMAEGAFALAESSFRAAVRQAARTDAYVNLAWLLQRRGAYAQAQQHIQVALQQDPQHSAAWHTYGLIHLRQRQWDEAQAALQRALELDPYNYLARFYTGLLYEQQGLHDESLSLLEAIQADNYDLLPAMQDELREALARLRG